MANPKVVDNDAQVREPAETGEGERSWEPTDSNAPQLVSQSQIVLSTASGSKASHDPDMYKEHAVDDIEDQQQDEPESGPSPFAALGN